MIKKKQNIKIFYVERIIKFTSDWYVVIYQAVISNKKILYWKNWSVIIVAKLNCNELNCIELNCIVLIEYLIIIIIIFKNIKLILNI